MYLTTSNSLMKYFASCYYSYLLYDTSYIANYLLLNTCVVKGLNICKLPLKAFVKLLTIYSSFDICFFCQQPNQYRNNATYFSTKNLRQSDLSIANRIQIFFCTYPATIAHPTSLYFILA